MKTRTPVLRAVQISLLCVPLGMIMAGVAMFLITLIHFFTNLAFHGALSLKDSSPLNNHLGVWVILVPVAGAFLVGLMARFGSKAIRGHGIPEAMEQVLENGSRIPARMTWLKPLSAAISIGTGGPFGAEGPIIATGSAGGSLLGQMLHTTAAERKTFLAAGAAAGMAATFGSPVSAVLLAVELLLFEYKARSFVPVAIASAIAVGVRNTWGLSTPVFAMPEIAPVTLTELSFYLALGIIAGVVSVLVSKTVYIIEAGFERLPIHWMWWPALGAFGVGIIGYIDPRTLGVGYENITHILNGNFAAYAVLLLCTLKFISWSIALGSGTSGGTLAPLLTFGSGLGFLLGTVSSEALPSFHIQPALASLVGMAALFAGASQALLASVVFACETTGHVTSLLPLLGGCSTALITARLLSKNSIMSEKIVRRGVTVPSEYGADIYSHVTVGEVMEKEFCTLPDSTLAQELMFKMMSQDFVVSRHHAFLLTSSTGKLTGIVTKGDMMWAVESPLPETTLLQLGTSDVVVAFPDQTLHEALEKMLLHEIGRLPVVLRSHPDNLVGYLSRSAILSAHWKSLQEETFRERSFVYGKKRKSQK